MSRRAHLQLLLTLLVGIVGILSAPAAAAERQPYIVVLKDSVQAPGQVAKAQAEQGGGELGFVYRHALKGYSVELPEAAVEGLRRNPNVDYIVPDGQVELLEEVELETEEGEGLEALEATIPTGISRTFAAGNKALDIDGVDDVRADVDVAIIDTGIVQTHPDLNVVARTNCTAAGEACANNSGTDGHSHGTHVAGTVAALDNSIGVVGMASGARLWAVKVLNDSGTGAFSRIIAGVDWVTARAGQIEVANMSLGGWGTNLALNKALETSTKAGIVYVAAAGNSAALASSFTPANNSKVITVSALADYDGKPGGKASPTCANFGLDDRLATFSNYGSAVEIIAPGVCILSSITSNAYGVKSGTSMAAPHVAGAAALLAAQSNPEDEEDVSTITNTLIARGNYNWTDTSGDGVKEPLLDVSNETDFALVSAPVVSTGAVAYAGVGSATQTHLTGTVDPKGLGTTYHFEYVPASKYKPEAENPFGEGGKVPTSPVSIGAGSKGEANEVKQAISGLEPSTTYYYRLVAENSKGVSKGNIQTFASLSACKGTEGKCEWSLQSPANPQPETNNDLEDVSCASASVCMAVGNDYYRGKGFAQHWNGSEWKIVNTFSGEIKAISCPTSTWCMTVAKGDGKGWQLKWVEFFTGSWNLESKTPPTPEGATSVQLNDVSCTSESACTAVGRYHVSGAYKPYVARWNGSSWSLQSAPSPAEGNASEAMLSVSCASSTYCVAVGKAAGKPFVERWNGSEWAIQSAPMPEGATEATLEGISCTSSNACMAVGYSKASGLATKTLSERWDGSKWSVVPTPALGKEGRAALRGIACLSASSCVAVGSLPSPSLFVEGETTLAETWNGVEWIVKSSPNPEGKAYSSFNAVSCTSGSACTAVGQAGPALGGGANTVTLAERWNGSSWSLQSAANPQPVTDTDLEDVSCASAAMCMAVGNDYYRGRGFAQHWNGSEWKIVETFSGEMKAVSCPTTTWCMTVAKTDGKGWQLKWVEFFTGSWSPESKAPPSPEGATEVKLSDVSCASESACTVVGRYSVSGAYKPYVARWNGSSWSLQSAPNPAEGNASEAMLSVSCASTTFCVAVGKAAGKPFVERWNGSEWAVQSAPMPEGATDATLEGVSCTSSSACMAVGNHNSGPFSTSKTLAQSWDGSKWSVVPTPALGKEGRPSLRSVSCLSASSCIAVGSLPSPWPTPEGETTVVEAWNGTAWTVQSSPNPESKAFSALSAVSCTSPVACTAVGQAGPSYGGGANTVTLAERFN